MHEIWAKGEVRFDSVTLALRLALGAQHRTRISSRFIRKCENLGGEIERVLHQRCQDALVRPECIPSAIGHTNWKWLGPIVAGCDHSDLSAFGMSCGQVRIDAVVIRCKLRQTLALLWAVGRAGGATNESKRPHAGIRGSEVLVSKRPLADPCKLKSLFDKPCGNSGSARVSLVRYG